MEQNRYQDNTSPEPTAANPVDCYRTPNLTHFMGLPNYHLYPTPPSENEDSTTASAGSSPYLATYQMYNSSANPKTESSYRQAISPTSYNPSLSSNKSFEETANCVVSPGEDKENTENATSRFKRRSRTTYSKHQVRLI